VGASRRGGLVRQHGRSVALRRPEVRGSGHAHQTMWAVRQFPTQESDRTAWLSHTQTARCVRALCKKSAGKRRAPRAFRPTRMSMNMRASNGLCSGIVWRAYGWRWDLSREAASKNKLGRYK
jgi:hypothetical protein